MLNVDDGVLRPQQELYLDWLCKPRAERDPDSKAKYAAAHSVSQQTLRNWEKNVAFREEWGKRVELIQGSPEKKSNLLDALYAKAMDGDVRSAELYLKATNQMAPPVMKVEVDRPSAQLSDAELDELIAARAVSEKRLRAV